MYPTRTTSTTGTFRVPPAEASPQAPAAPQVPQALAPRGTGELYPAPQRPPAPEPAPATTAATPAPYAAQGEPDSEPQAPSPRPAVEPAPAAEAATAAIPAPYAVQAAPESALPAAGPLPHPAEVEPEAPPPPADPHRHAAPAAPAAFPHAAHPGPEVPSPSAPAEPAAVPRLAHAAQAEPEPARTAAPAGLFPGAEAVAVTLALAPYAAQAGPESTVAAAGPLPHEAQASPPPAVADPLRGAEDRAPGLGDPLAYAARTAPESGGSREVAVPHGRPAADTDTGWSEVPAARVRVEPEPVHALAGGVDRAESGGISYGQEPDPVVCVPAPAGSHDENAHTGVATLRLRALDGGGEPPSPQGPVWPAEAGPVVAGPVVDGPGRRYGEPWPPAGPQSGSGLVPGSGSGPGSGPAHPHPHPHGDADAEGRPTGVPGPAVAEIVAQAVARGMEGDTQDLPRVAPVRGAAATEVPVHLPFRGEARPAAPKPPAAGSAPRTSRPAAPGRRVPRGDERLREHRGPVLPGWVGVGVGGLALAGCLAVLWRAGAVPATFVAAFGASPRAYHGLRATHWPPLAFLGIVALLALGGLGRAKAGHAWVLTLFGRYRGTVRRTGLTWVSPLLLRRRVDVRLRHWRSDPMPAVDSGGLALRVVVQVVWQVKDTARATLAVEDHTEYLAEQVESAMARVLSQLPADAFHEDAPTLRDSEAVGDALTRMLATETEAVGIEVYSAQPTRIEYAPEVADAMRRRRVAAIDAKHRDTVLTSVVDAVDDTVHRLTSRGLVELDDYERKALVKDLTVAFYTGRPE
ncbi:SPFH domain-containing protein [Streptomyces sp. NBC_00211]|uniref:SPFH domain-containing protein n=1 Tax=Streptomyces sp. NBC_00211 TaxID=2975683 RepID=UPI003255BAD4